MSDENEGTDPNKDSPREPHSTNSSVPEIPQNQVGRNNQKYAATGNEDNAATKHDLHILEKINIFGQLGLVIVGIIAAFIYGCQLKSMNKQLVVMQDTLSQVKAQYSMSAETNGAYIFPVKKTLRYHPDNGDSVQFVIEPRNRGNITPDSASAIARMRFFMAPTMSERDNIQKSTNGYTNLTIEHLQPRKDNGPGVYLHDGEKTPTFPTIEFVRSGEFEKLPSHIGKVYMWGNITFKTLGVTINQPFCDYIDLSKFQSSDARSVTVNPKEDPGVTKEIVLDDMNFKTCETSDK